MVFGNLYSKAALVSIRGHFNVHILEQERKRNKAAFLLNQQNHKFYVTNKSQYHTL